MKIPTKQFELCPEFAGMAVCVDVTDPETRDTKYGERDQFNIVFEIDLDREDPPEDQSPYYCIWSHPFTPSWGARSSFRRFLFQWFGRALTEEEMESFDTEELIGRPAKMTIGHEEGEDGKTYSRILLCRPVPDGEAPLVPSGKFTRRKARRKDEEGGREAGAQFKRAEKPRNVPEKPASRTAPGAAEKDPAGVQIHVGTATGLYLRDLDQAKIAKLISNWLDNEDIAKTTANDKRLATALEHYRAKFAREEKQKAAVTDY